MAEEWERWLARWTREGIVSADIAARIRAFETSQVQEHRLRWPILLALGCGVVALSAGVLLLYRRTGTISRLRNGWPLC
jgi:hypothetical protein